MNTFSFVDSELRELDFNGVYKLDINSNKISLISKDIEVPNGIGISPDEKFLYVNKMGPPFSNSSSKIIKIDLETLESKILYEGVDMFQNIKMEVISMEWQFIRVEIFSPQDPEVF